MPAALAAMFAGGFAALGDPGYEAWFRDRLGVGYPILFYLLAGGAIFAGTVFAERLITAVFWDGLVRRAFGQRVPRLLVQISSAAVYVAGLFLIVGLLFEESLTGLFAASGAVGIVVGFALRGIILDAFSGIAISADRPFDMGEWVSIQGRGMDTILGRVEEVHWRTTRLRTEHNEILIVPNGELSTAVIRNLSRADGATRQHVDICLDFAVPQARALAILDSALLAAAQNGAAIATQRRTEVRVEAIEDGATTYRLVYWIRLGQTTTGSARDAVLRAVQQHLNAAGLHPSIPKEDLGYARAIPRALSYASGKDRAMLLRRVELLAEVPPATLERLAEAAASRRFGAGERVIAAGDAGASMFVLLEGVLKVAIPAPDGERDVGRIAAGEYFGEMSLMTGAPRSATVTTLTPSVCLEITKDALAGVLDDQPELADSMARKAAELRVRNDAALAALPAAAQAAETHTLAQELIGRMRRFFGRAPQPAGDPPRRSVAP